jgi:hypothetical protein
MAINAVFNITVLAVRARIEAGKEGNSVDLILRRDVFVLETAIVTFCARSPQVVVIAQLIAVPSFLYAV